MRARLKSLHSPDVSDLENWSPGPKFGAFVQAFVGPVDGEGEESFNLTVCSPSWFEERLAREQIRSGRHTIFMNEYSYRRLYAFIERAVQGAEGVTWKELADRLSWLGQWEFAE